MNRPPAAAGLPGGEGVARPGFRGALVVFGNRNFRWLWISSLFSFTGMQMQQVARALLAWDLTGSFGAVGLISLSFGLPMLILALPGGSLADRFDKRNLSLATQLVTAVLAAAHAVMVTTGTMNIEWLFVLGLFGGAAMALGMPARMPLTASAVGPANLMAAMAMGNAAMNATRLVGPAIAGAMIGVWNLESAYWAQAILNIIACVALLVVPAGIGNVPMQAVKGRGRMFREIGEGLRYVATDPRLRVLNGMMFVVAFFAMPHVMLLAGFVKEDLGQGDSAFGILQSVSGVGALIGSLGIATLTLYDRKAMIQWGAGIIGGFGLISLALFSYAFGYAGAIAAVVIIGFALTGYQTLNSAMLMDATKPEYYGRVMSINMLSFSAMPLMAFPLGALADRMGAHETFIAEGCIVIGFMLLAALLNPKYTFGRVPVRARTMPFPGARPPGPIREATEDASPAR